MAVLWLLSVTNTVSKWVNCPKMNTWLEWMWVCFKFFSSLKMLHNWLNRCTKPENGHHLFSHFESTYVLMWRGVTFKDYISAREETTTLTPAEDSTYGGGGDSSVVRAPDSWLKGRGFESLQERRKNFLLQGRLSVLTLISVSVPPPCYRSQKCRWQVTAKHTYTLRMWLCMKWHGTWLYGVHKTCAEMAAVSCGTSHASAVSTPLRWIFKNAL